MRLIRYIFSFALLMITPTGFSADSSVQSDSLRDVCLRELRDVLRTQELWIKVHAAEYLLWLNEPAEVQATYQQERQRFETEAPYRIGIWRVLTQATTNLAEKKQWIDKIAAAFKDPNGPDRIHAAETLAKLGISPATIDAEATRLALASSNRPLALYTLWGASLNDPTTLAKNRRTFLNLAVSPEEDAASRRLGAFVLRRLGGLTDLDWQKLAETALAEPATSPVRINLLHAAWATSPKAGSALENRLRNEMLAVQKSSAVGDQLELVAVLAEKGLPTDVPVLVPLLKHENADVRAGAAYAILKIERKKK